jgi:hypothetical protein
MMRFLCSMVTTMIFVNSSSIRALDYHGGTLYVTFHTGRTYPHPGVPYEIFLRLFHAESKGTYYNKNIRGRYR